MSRFNKNLAFLVALAILLLVLPKDVLAQQASVVSTSPSLSAGFNAPLFEDTSGNLRVLATFGSGSTVTANQGTPGAQASPWWVRPTDGTNNMPMGDSSARPIFFRLTDGASAFSFGQQSAALSLSVINSNSGFTIGNFPTAIPVNIGASSASTPRFTAASDGIAPIVAGSAVSSSVLKASAGNLLNVYTTPTTDGWLMVFNATSLPANGATTSGSASGNMQECIKAPANVTSSISYSPAQVESFSVGITAAFSSTNCATLTASANAFIHGTAQ